MYPRGTMSTPTNAKPISTRTIALGVFGGLVLFSLAAVLVIELVSPGTFKPLMEDRDVRARREFNKAFLEFQRNLEQIRREAASSRSP